LNFDVVLAKNSHAAILNTGLSKMFMGCFSMACQHEGAPTWPTSQPGHSGESGVRPTGH